MHPYAPLDALIFLGIVLALFLIGREVVCWYWKLNRIVELLESIDRQLSTRP